MAITRFDINGNFAALKNALDQYKAAVGGFTVQFDDDENPTKIICNDLDGNTIFTISKNSSSTGYKYSIFVKGNSPSDPTEHSTGYDSSTSNTFTVPTYFYIVGGSAMIVTGGGGVIVIAETGTATIGFCMNKNLVPSDPKDTFIVGSWGDDPALTDDLKFTPMIGNQTLLVPIPLHDSLGFLPMAFFTPMIQAGMKNTVQQLQDGNDIYLTNGHISLQDY